MSIPKFSTQKELFNYLIANERMLIAEKKSQNKFTDALVYTEILDVDADNTVTKASGAVNKTPSINSDVIQAKLVINTTNIMDSHGDVHIDGIWTKSLSENKTPYLLQEHKLTFQGVISDEVRASVKRMNWIDVGYSYTGTTQALVFDCTIRKSRNEYMFDQYASGYVKNHSVGMRYVKLFLCVNDEAYPEYKAMWDKYISKVVNFDDAEKKGYFWAVTEAAMIEGSAVLVGSNCATPTLEITDKNTEPLNSTQSTEPPVGTRNKSHFLIM